MSTESNGDRTTDIHVSLKPANGGENDRGQEDDAGLIYKLKSPYLRAPDF